MDVVRFRHKGLKQLHEDGNAKRRAARDGGQVALFALETAETMDQLRKFPGWRLHSLRGELGGIVEPEQLVATGD